MFQFADLPLSRMASRHTGSPIRIPRVHRSCAPPPGFSQLSTSFFGCDSLGILRVPLFAFFSNSSPLLAIVSLFLFIPTIHFPLSSFFFGGDKRVRTADLCLARAALSQLSYIPILAACLLGGHDWTRTSDPCVISTVL